MDVYKENGFDSRKAYLKDLAENLDVPLSIVHMIAGMLGEREDFDGLVTSLEDYETYQGEFWNANNQIRKWPVCRGSIMVAFERINADRYRVWKKANNKPEGEYWK